MHSECRITNDNDVSPDSNPVFILCVTEQTEETSYNWNKVEANFVKTPHEMWLHAMSDTTREQQRKQSIFSTLLFWHNSWKRWVCTVGTTQKRGLWVEMDWNKLNFFWISPTLKKSQMMSYESSISITSHTGIFKYVPFQKTHKPKACIKLAPNCFNSCTIKIQTQDLCPLCDLCCMVGH